MMKDVKCLVWDLDNTLWQGTLLENEDLSLTEGVVEVIKTLDERGILQSIASRNDYEAAMQQLRSFGLEEFFLFPQINWNSKAVSIERIRQSINIGIDTIAFIDDQAYEREEVNFSLPEVRCIDAVDLNNLLSRPDMNPRFITSDSRNRRQMMMADIARQEVEGAYEGPQEEFLASLDMILSIFPAQEEDLQRAEELTVRTNQLNATGYTYSYDELNFFRQSADHKLLMARLEDKFGTYGHIGLALVECGQDVWTIKLLLMSCRVMSRGVGGVMLNYIMKLAREAGVALQAEFVPTDRNRMMNITYRFAGFSEQQKYGDLVIFTHDLADLQPFPAYMRININETVK